ncbi:MAG: signal peptidase I [Lentisphaeria bacterium]|jgi:signal peptidase I
MDINLPLLLFLAVAFTGVTWLVDLAFFSKSREQKIAAVDGQFSSLTVEQKQQDESYKKAMETVSLEPVLVEYSKSFFPVLFLVFALRSFIVEPFQIPSESMVPTLEVGDFILVNKFTYGIRLPLIRTKILDINTPKRGEVMVFFPPNKDQYFIKRIVGLPGDVIRYADNVLYVNGEKMKQELAYTDPRIDNACNYIGRGQGEYVVVNETFGDVSHLMRKCESPLMASSDRSWKVPEGHFFMMGDNRDNSSDSRVWGAVPEERIVGKAFAIWMHWESLLSIPSFSRVGAI